MDTSRWAPTTSATPASYTDDATPFAQTGCETNELFADDFTPIAEPVSQPVLPEAPRSLVPHFRPPRGDRDAKRARGRGRGGRTAPLPESVQPDGTGTHVAAEEPLEITEDAAQVLSTASKANAASAVRGDRSQTGGLIRPRLTEEELTAKLEAVRLNNAKREEAHRAAEADEASFKAQEAQALERKREDTMNRKRMEAEREKNRARKLAGRNGREWDEGKEEDVGRAKGKGYRRGAHGSVPSPVVPTQTGDIHTGYVSRAEGIDGGRPSRQRGDYNTLGGRSGRGRGRGRGRGPSGSFEAGEGHDHGDSPALGYDDFPALTQQPEPSSKAEMNALGSAVKVQSPGEDRTGSPAKLEAPTATAKSRHARSPWRVTDEPKTSWADQVEEGS